MTDALRLRYTPPGHCQIGVQAQWFNAGCFAATTGASDLGFGPSITRLHSLIGVGEVRLDNRKEVALSVDTPEQHKTDLDLVLAAIHCHGSECIPRLWGDFAFVVWDGRSHELLAARDAFGVRALHFMQSTDLLVLSSRASLLACCDSYSLEFIADMLVDGDNPTELNPFSGVTTLPSGSMLTRRASATRVTEYWSAEQFEISTTSAEQQAEKFRDLFTTAVRVRLTGQEDVWAQLSGGLDSSSIVCMAQALEHVGIAANGVAGTITMVDSLGEGDEREFVRGVMQQWPVLNAQVLDYWLWQEDGQSPPLIENPSSHYPFYARDRRCCEIVRSAGGRVLLTGIGADHYLSWLPYFIADWLASGHPLKACREIMRWSVLTRTSFWQTALQNGVRPLLPPGLQNACRPRSERTPAWIDAGFAKRYAVADRDPLRGALKSPIGGKYAGAIAHQIMHFGRYSDRTLFDETLDVRHPFLYRPLVEFSLQLAPELRTRPLAEKWILREAMRGILPEPVRTRTGKGGIDSRMAWSLVHERDRVEELIRNPLLSQLGCVDPNKLRAAVVAQSGHDRHLTLLVSALSLETWLRVQSGRWAVRESTPPQASQLM